MKIHLSELRTIVRGIILESEKDLMLDKPGTIVEPDVRKKIRDYFRKMGLVARDDVKGKRWS